MHKATNPFKFGDPVEGDYYLSRPELTNTVTQFIENRIHVVLIGPRRFGKTSFVLNLFNDLEASGSSCLFIDIFNVTSHRDFLQQIIRALRSKKSWGNKLKDWFKTISRLKPSLSWNTDSTTGEISYSLSTEVSSDKDIKETIQDVLLALENLGDKVIVAIDEFQKIAELDDQGWLEATLRSHMQHLKNTAFLFTGSRRHIINDMINNVARPFYRSCQPIEFPSFGEEFTSWIVERFSLVGINCENQAINKLRELVQDTPNYVQMACFHIVAAGARTVNEDEIQTVLKTIVKQNSYAYQTLLNSLTAIQQRALRLAAKENEQIFSRDLLSKYEISSGPALASAIKALKDKQILDEGTAKGKVVFDDPLFAIWLRMEFED